MASSLTVARAHCGSPLPCRQGAASKVQEGRDRPVTITRVANCTLLLVSDSAEPPSEYEPVDALLGANYSLPLLWLSLFTTAEILLWPSTLESTWTYAAVIGRRDACLARTRSRIDLWGGLWPRTFDDIGPTWLNFINDRPGQFFAIWTEELAEMYESAEEWRRIFSAYLEALDQPTEPAFTEVLAQSYLAIDRDGKRLIGTSEDSVSLLAGGYSWAVHAPWE